MSNEDELWIGFDLGGTKMMAVAFDGNMKERSRRRRKTKGREGSESGIERIATTIERMLEEANLTEAPISGIGIGCPGPIDMDRGRILSTPNLGWDEVDIRDFLTKRFKCPVAVANDVDAGVYGEYKFGAAKGARCVVGIFPGTGVGGGCIYDGKILCGAGISCMEIGHVRVSSATRTSGDGMIGTVEALASRLAIAAEGAKAAQRGLAPHLYKTAGADIAQISSGVLADSIAAGDKVIRRLVEEAAQTIGVAVVNVVHLLAPDVIVLGGGIVEAMEELFVDTVRKTAKAGVMSVYRDRFEVKAAKLGDMASAMGAAAWAKDQGLARQSSFQSESKSKEATPTNAGPNNGAMSKEELLTQSPAQTLNPDAAKVDIV
jgi:glucokinase